MVLTNLFKYIKISSNIKPYSYASRPIMYHYGIKRQKNGLSGIKFFLFLVPGVAIIRLVRFLHADFGIFHKQTVFHILLEFIGDLY